LKTRLEKREALRGPNDFVVKQLREQLASIQQGQPSTYLQFTVGARSLGGKPPGQPSSPSNDGSREPE
jgi:hypothetical protein